MGTLVVAAATYPGASVDVSDVRLSDFGAASAVPEGEDGVALQRMEARSFGWLLQDLLDILQDFRLDPSGSDADIVSLLRSVRGRCAHTDMDQLPSFQDLAMELAKGIQSTSPRGTKRGIESRM